MIKIMNDIIEPKDKKIIVFVGIMGSGKTTIGRRLANKLKIDFIDSDKEIEKKCYKTINKIFTQFGEEYFRKVEKEVIFDIVSNNKPVVLSLGGGAFIDDDIRNLIKRECVSVWLNVDIDTILTRIGNKTNRPLLNNVNKREILLKLLKIRTPFYKECDIEIDIGLQSHSKTVNELITKLQQII